MLRFKKEPTPQRARGRGDTRESGGGRPTSQRVNLWYPRHAKREHEGAHHATSGQRDVTHLHNSMWHLRLIHADFHMQPVNATINQRSSPACSQADTSDSFVAQATNCLHADCVRHDTDRTKAQKQNQ